MAKHDSPPFKMVIEQGKIVPATAYDQERLDTYRNGTKVNVVIVRDGGRPMERKWFAILGLVVKQCNVPWKNKDQASEAIKLALGIVNYTKTISGQFMAYPKSLVDLTDPELDDAVRDMMDLIQKMTGIDPATLKKEAADVGGEDEQESSEDAANHPDDGGGGEDAPHHGPAADPVEENAAAPETEQSTVGAASPDIAKLKREAIAKFDKLKREAIAKFLAAATDKTAPDPKDRQETVAFAKEAWKQTLPDDWAFVKACTDTANKVLKGELKIESARRYLEGLL